MDTSPGKVAFVTGGGSGIGFGIAQTFVSNGIKVAIVDVREDRLVRARHALSNYSDDVLTIECDVTDIKSLQEAAEQTEAKFGNVHIVCNNAGIGGAVGPFPESNMEAWERIVGINLWGVIYGVKVFAEKIIRHSEGGHFVNTASIMGLYSTARSMAYCTTKFAVVGFSECLRQDMEKHNIGVSVLCPYVVDTPIFYPDLADDDLAGIKARKERLQVMKSAIDPARMGELVLKGIQANEPYIFSENTQTPRMINARVDQIHDSLARQSQILN